MARSLEDSETVAVATTNDGVKQTLSPAGEAALSEIAETCHLKQPWPEVKELLKARIAVNLSNEPADATDKGDTVKDYHDRIIQALDTFHDAPFTIQRLSELAIHPTEHHRSIWKYLRALEKVLLVTSSDDPRHMDVDALKPVTASSRDLETQSSEGEGSAGLPGADVVPEAQITETDISKEPSKLPSSETINGTASTSDVRPMDVD